MDFVMSNSRDKVEMRFSSSIKPEKVIIDTDPGIDDAMAILKAFQTPQLEILGFTTIFGDIGTEAATRNALLLIGQVGLCVDKDMVTTRVSAS